VVVHQHDNVSDAFVEVCKFNGYINILAVTDLTPSYIRAQLKVVRCTLAQPEKVNN